MKTCSSKLKNIIASLGINGFHATELLKEACHAFRSLVKASPAFIKMAAMEMLKEINVMDLLRRKKRSSNHDGINFIMNSTSTVLKLDYLSHHMTLHDCTASHNNNNNTYFSLQPSLMMERISNGRELSGCSVNNTAVSAEEVDELADAFISRFYNNVRLEKQRSCKSYQEMLARGT